MYICRFGAADEMEPEDEDALALAGEQEEQATSFELPK